MKTLLVMAAGMGSRFGWIKQLTPVGPHDAILLDYSIFDAIRAGFTKVVFVTREELLQDFRERIGDKYEGKISVEYVFQRLDDLPSGYSVPEWRMKPWGTGHAVRAARHAIHEPFAVINADDFYGRWNFLALGSYDPAPNEHVLVSYRLADTLSDFGGVSRGVCQIADGKLVQVREHTEVARMLASQVPYDPSGSAFRATDPSGNAVSLTGDERVSMNSWGFSPCIFDALESDFSTFLSDPSRLPKGEFFLPTVAENQIRRSEAVITCLEANEKCFGMTYREDLAAVTEALGQLITEWAYPEKLF